MLPLLSRLLQAAVILFRTGVRVRLRIVRGEQGPFRAAAELESDVFDCQPLLAASL